MSQNSQIHLPVEPEAPIEPEAPVKPKAPVQVAEEAAAESVSSSRTDSD